MTRPKRKGNPRKKPQALERLALPDLGLDPEQQTAFLQGKAVVYNFPGKTEPAIAFIQMVGTRLRCGIFSLRERGGGFALLSRFRAKSRAMAKAFRAEELELFGAAVINHRLEGILLRHGFMRAMEPIPESLGGGTMEILSKVFDFRSQRGN